MKTHPAHDDVGRLAGARLSRTVPAEVCPDAEILAAYVDDGLSEGERSALEQHLSKCASCRALMARLAPLEAAAPAPAAVSVLVALLAPVPAPSQVG